MSDGHTQPALSFDEGVQAQPDNLRAAAAAITAVLAGADLAPLRTGTLVLSGIGASWHALAPCVRALQAGGRRAFAVPSGELAQAGAANLGDAYIVVSQSGKSTEPLAAVQTLRGAPLVVISAYGDSPLAQAADLWLPLGPVPDTPLSTLAYTATLQALGLLCEVLLGMERGPDWDRLPELVRDVLDGEDARAAAVAARWHTVAAIDAIGGGAAVCSAGETALLVREGLRLPGYGDETRQYLHGPLEAVDAKFGCVAFGRERELRLADTLVGCGAAVAVVTDQPAARVAGAELFQLPVVADLARPVLEILPVQLLVGHLARAWALPVDGLRREQDDTKAA